MLVISSKEFRDNQAAYFDRADEVENFFRFIIICTKSRYERR